MKTKRAVFYRGALQAALEKLWEEAQDLPEYGAYTDFGTFTRYVTSRGLSLVREEVEVNSERAPE